MPIALEPIGTIRRTGEICPQTGVWRSSAYPSTSEALTSGDTMPYVDGRKVFWELIAYG